jgi:amino acid adenylation domain-containing protein
MTRFLQDAISACAEARPEATALVWDHKKKSYGELEAMSNRVAQVLLDTRRGAGDRAAILIPKGFEAVSAILGALKAGAVYVPLDPAEPPARMARTHASAECRWILAADIDGAILRNALAFDDLRPKPLIGWLGEHSPLGAPPVVFARDDLDSFPATRPQPNGGPAGLAQILFTSGSTGQPKGVMIPHETILCFLDWARDYFGICAADRISQHAPLRFDLSTFDIFGTLGTGAELHIVPPQLNLLPHRLGKFIRDHRLTQILCVPSVLNMLAKFDVVRDEDFPELRRVLFAGEVLPTPVLAYWMRKLPHVQFTNLYGPTETTIASTYYTIPEPPTSMTDPIPIGRACAGEDVLILGHDLKPVTGDETGDLYIRGAGVTDGYWRDPGRTAAAFLTDPEHPESGRKVYRTGDRARRDGDGLVYFCGRGDQQIKSRGYRIELEEIEAALNVQEDLFESAVVAVESTGFEGHLICCAYVPRADADLDESTLRSRLGALIPSYMLPMRWMRYESLPRNANGKVDRPLLAQAFRDSIKHRMESRSR